MAKRSEFTNHEKREFGEFMRPHSTAVTLHFAVCGCTSPLKSLGQHKHKPHNLVLVHTTTIMYRNAHHYSMTSRIFRHIRK